VARIDVSNIKKWIEIAERSGYRVKVFCKEVNVCQRQLQRYTQEAFGRSPQDWLDEQRLIAAPEILRRYCSAKVASSELGFKQVSHFSREFKRYYGISPRAFIAEIEATARSKKTRIALPQLTSVRLFITTYLRSKNLRWKDLAMWSLPPNLPGENSPKKPRGNHAKTIAS